jgi:hypothetical protein
MTKKHDRLTERVSGGRYLVQMIGGLEPEIRGPFQTEDKRDRAAKKVHEIMKEEDNIFALDIDIQLNPKGGLEIRPSTFTYSGGFFGESEG